VVRDAYSSTDRQDRSWHLPTDRKIIGLGLDLGAISAQYPQTVDHTNEMSVDTNYTAAPLLGIS